MLMAMYFILLHTLAQTTSISICPHVLKKDMFSFYTFLKKPIFLSFWGNSGCEMGRKVLRLCSKLKQK